MRALILFAIILNSCAESTNKPQPTGSPTREGLNYLMAKTNADSVFYYINEATNLMVAKKLSAKSKRITDIMKKADPFQKKLDSLKGLLTPDELNQVDRYRTELYLKIEQGKY